MKPYELDAMPHVHGAWAEKLRAAKFTPTFEWFVYKPAPREPKRTA